MWHDSSDNWVVKVEWLDRVRSLTASVGWLPSCGLTVYEKKYCFPVLGTGFRAWYLGLVVFIMHQKEEFTFSVSFCNQRNLSRKASSAANTKSTGWRYVGFCKKHSVKDRRLSLCFRKMVLLSTPLHTIIVFIWTRWFNS